MTLRSLRLLPPLAFARLGSASDPLDSYVLVDDPDHPLGYRRVQGALTLIVDEVTGEIRETRVPDVVRFREDGDRIRPVAPFLEVFVQTDADVLEPLTLELLQQHGLSLANLSWRAVVANRKVVRRTGDRKDLVHADTGWFSGHETQRLEGHSENFVAPDRFIDFGHVRFIKPNVAYPEIRLRFTPAQGLIYGPDKPNTVENPPVVPPARALYDTAKGGWCGYEVQDPDDPSATTAASFQNDTLPSALFAIIPPAPPWQNNDIAVSRGYLDDACDGFVEAALTLADGQRLVASARVSSGPPAVVPDSLFVRSLADDLDQALLGPDVPKDEPYQVTRARAEDIVRRAFETVRFMNVALMNGNGFKGRPALSFDTMPTSETGSLERPARPVMPEESVDTLAVMALHQQVFAALRGGAAPWFLQLLRRPEAVGDYSDRGRRKMPALMCGADGNYLALTHRQIDTIGQAVNPALFRPSFADETNPGSASPGRLTPRNLSAQLHYEAIGNPASSRPAHSIGNCCPGLELDFRAVWRRVLGGIVLREYDNLVTEADHPDTKHLEGHRLLRIDGVQVMTQMKATAPGDPDGGLVVLSTDDNPEGLTPLEWSNALARVLHERKGKTVRCDFSSEPSWYAQVAWSDDPKTTYIHMDLEVRPLFDEGTAVISRALADAGELTQGLCSPWQNDFRECSCYYWASARPDYVNVEPAASGGSRGDSWFQKVRTGEYVPDDYVDSRLVLYEDLFLRWEHWLRFQVGGRDADASNKEPD